LLLVSALVWSGCERGDGFVAPDALEAEVNNEIGAASVSYPSFLEMSPRTDTIFVGDSLQITAVVYDEEGNEMSVTPTWLSSHPEVASVSPSGLAVAHAPGVATIFAQITGRWGWIRNRTTLWIRPVSAPPPNPSPVADVVVSPSTRGLRVDGTATLTARGFDGSGNEVGGATLRPCHQVGS
jgi:hypothetical protein